MGIVEGTETLEAAAAEREWKKHDNIAMMLICSSIDKKYMSVLVNCKTLATMWLCLIIVHEQNSRENNHIMQQWFFEFQMKPAQDMSSFIAAVEAMAAQLNDMGKSTTDKSKVKKAL